VSKTHRRQGIAIALINELKRIGAARGTYVIDRQGLRIAVVSLVDTLRCDCGKRLRRSGRPLLREGTPRTGRPQRVVCGEHVRGLASIQLLCAELAARGLDGWVYNSVQTPCITDEAVLPSFQRRQGAGGYLWPRWR
jgi:hypothetical protein